MKPTVLIAATFRWFPTARLGMALANAGFAVAAVCPPRHPICSIRTVSKLQVYRGLNALASFSEAIAKVNPHIVIPCDDLAVQHLHQLYGRERLRGARGEAVCALLERSLGASASFSILGARAPFMKLAEEEGIRVPATAIVANDDELRARISEWDLPIVLKSDGTSGGDGVRIARSLDEAQQAFRTLQAPPLLARAVKRALLDQDTRWVWPSLLRRRSTVNAQAFVAGSEATSTVACWQGTVLASLHFEVLSKQDASGPSTVVRLIEHPEMSAAAERMVRRLNLSGMYGFDFMLEAQSSKAYLIEINPRATQVGHLTLGPGRDLPAALYAALTGRPIQESSPVTDKDTITLFPHEWLRNPESPFLRSSYHDVPWEEPEFVRLCVGTRKKRDRLYSQRGWARSLSPARMPRR